MIYTFCLEVFGLLASNFLRNLICSMKDIDVVCELYYQFEISQLPFVSILISFHGLFFIFPSSDIGFLRLRVEIKYVGINLKIPYASFCKNPTLQVKVIQNAKVGRWEKGIGSNKSFIGILMNLIHCFGILSIVSM